MNDLDIRRVAATIKKIEELEKSGFVDHAVALKICLMECSGWIEEKMSSILLKVISKTIPRTPKNVILTEYIKKEISNINYSFDYNSFRNKLINTIGLIKVTVMERKLDNHKGINFEFDRFKKNLEELQEERNRLAHSFTRRSLLTFKDIDDKLNYIYNGLKVIKKYL